MKKKEIAREEGFAEGELRGAQQNTIANAKSMLTDSVSEEQVAKWTSLPLEQVLTLKNEMVQA